MRLKSVLVIAGLAVVATACAPPPPGGGGADTEAPVLSLPADIERDADPGPPTAVVTFSVTATDDTDPSPVVTCTPASGSTFILGTTLVTCTATDQAGNTAAGSFTITVVDSQAPVLTLPFDFEVPTDPDTDTAVVTFLATADDDIDPPSVATCTPASGSTFILGTNTVACTATDQAGNTAAGSFTITVVDAEAPL